MPPKPSKILSRDDTGKIFAHIETEHLIIKSIEDGDLENMIKLQGDDEVMKFVGAGGAREADKTTRYHRWLVNLWQEGNPISGYMVFEKEGNKFAGMACLEEVFDEKGKVKEGEAEVMLYFLRDFWRRGYGKELGEKFIESIAQIVEEESSINIGGKPLQKIVATAHPENQASIKLQESLGFKKIGIGKKISGGKEMERVFFELDLTKLKKISPSQATPSAAPEPELAQGLDVKFQSQSQHN